jgi:ASPM-SPD-2-Hydin domain-containing protein/LVIVD repeat-containing protein
MRKCLPTLKGSAYAVLFVASSVGCREAPQAPLERGSYQSPLVRLQQLVGDNDHLHTDEVRYRAGDGLLFHCSYNFGVIDARDPERMVYLAQELRHRIPGDRRQPGCVHLAWDGDTVYTAHRGNIDNPAFLSGWLLQRDTAIPEKLTAVQLPVLQEPGVSYEGIDTANGLIYAALRRDGLGIYRQSPTGFHRVGTFAGLENAWGVRVRGNTAFVTDGLNGLAIVDVTDAKAPALLGRAAIDGQARGLALDGHYAYVAAGSAGLVVVDISDLRAPKVIGAARVSGSAIRVDYSEGLAFVAAWNDARVYDVSNPVAPRFVGATRMTRDIGREDDGRPDVTSRTLGVAAYGNVMFAGNWHVIHSFRVHKEQRAPSLVLPEDVNLVDFGPVAPGAVARVPLAVRNQGTAPLTIFDTAIDHPSFKVEPRELRVPPGETATFTLAFEPQSPDKATALLRFSSDDPDNPARQGYLVANQPGLGVGKRFPDASAALVDGGRWASTALQGHVALVAYFATF